MTNEIDLVYTWVDGNDPQWQARHNAFKGLPVGEANDGKGRYFDNEELRFSLRSIEAYAPWIRKIFIVTDRQVPQWLDASNPRIQIVDHTEILPPEALPTFNAFVLEHALHRIPGLSERFLYSNDDTFLNKPVTPETFFAADGLPRVRFTRQGSRELSIFLKTKIVRHKVSSYVRALQNSSRLVQSHYGIYFNCDPHHNIDAYLRSDYERTAEEFKDAIEPTLTHHLREDSDISRSLYSYVAVARKRAHLEYVGRDTSFRLRIQSPKLYDVMERCQPTFFCVNDSEHVSDEDRRRARRFMETRFPDKSSFEK